MNTPIMSQHEEKSAPWLERTKEKADFLRNVIVTMEKREYIPTDDFLEVRECDEWFNVTYIPDEENVDWIKDYEHNCVTLPMMLEELRKYAEEELQTTHVRSLRAKQLRRLISACRGWQVTNIETEEV